MHVLDVHWKVPDRPTGQRSDCRETGAHQRRLLHDTCVIAKLAQSRERAIGYEGSGIKTLSPSDSGSWRSSLSMGAYSSLSLYIRSTATGHLAAILTRRGAMKAAPRD